MVKNSMGNKGENKDGERLVALEVEVKNVGEKMNGLENSISSLHGKMDAFTKLMSEKYLATATFEEYKKTVIEQQKNDLLQKVLIVILTASITSLIAFFVNRVII